jgi:hypothetical protein
MRSIIALVYILVSFVNAQDATSSCIVCPDGASAGDDFAPFGDSGDLTSCSEMIDAAKQYATGTELCAMMQMDAVRCCPTAIENSCMICPDGATTGDDIVPYADMGFNMTCAELIEDYKLYESDSNYCQVYGELDKVYCCPPPVEDACIICPNGTTVAGSVIPFADLGDTRTCNEVIDYAKLFESNSNYCFQDIDEAACCPPPPENPCIVCPNGTTAAADFAPYAAMGIMTCSELVEFDMQFETDSDMCTLEIDEAYCCPTAPDDPCIICRDGATADDDFLLYGIGANQTCKELIDFAKNFETGSDYCKLSEIEEVFCCPTAPENPCKICSAGITAGGDVAIDFGGFSMTCQLLVDSIALFDVGSDFCFQLGPMSEQRCCPAETGDTINFIPVAETSTAATTIAVPERTDTGVSEEITTVTSTPTVSSPVELAELDLEDLTPAISPAFTSTSSPVSTFGGFAYFILLVSALHFFVSV